MLQRSDNYLLYPVCETSIPPARQGGIRIWGSGNSHTVNIKVCVDADDYLFFREAFTPPPSVFYNGPAPVTHLRRCAEDDRLWMQYGAEKPSALSPNHTRARAPHAGP